MLRSLMFALEDSSGIAPDVLANIEEHVVAFQRHCDASIDLTASGDLELFSDSQHIAVERVVREALSNIAKHADASCVTIELRGDAKTLVARISDDGRGFSPANARAAADGVGLTAMRQRLEMIGGTLNIDSRPGGPTTLTAAIRKWRPADAIAESPPVLAAAAGSAARRC
jgi:signal transduction histidine kinase